MPQDDGLRLDQTARFLDLLRSDLIAAGGATLALGAIAVGFQAWDLLWLCAVGWTSALIRFSGGRLAKRGDLPQAVALYAGGFWAWSLFAVALVPLGMPVFLFNVLVPVVVAATYLEDHQHRLLAFGAVPVIAVFSLLGTMQDGLRIQELGPDWAVNATIAGFLISHCWMFTAAIRDGNRTLVASLDASLDRNERLQASESALRESRRRVVEVADAERGRIERDIHDGAQQRLVSLAVRLKLAGQLVETTAVTSAQLDDLHAEATAALKDLRDLASGIYPSLLVERGLTDALRALCRRTEGTVRWEHTLDQPVAERIAIHLYFVANEALQNAVKHGGPDVDIVVQLTQEVDELVLSVSDDGLGFDVINTQHSRGLLNMQDRVGSLNGTLSITSMPAGLTTIEARVPLEATGRPQ